MPHFIVEHSANLSERHDLKELAKVIHAAAVETGIFPLVGIRVRLYEAKIYEIADGHEENAFLAIVARIGAGRTIEARKAAAKSIFRAVCDFLGDDLNSGHLMVSFDMDENDPDVSFKKNSVRTRLAH
ncbi:5-carboxymethyl-2-hydroxymuconate isomerase [Pseudahrensia aquimaris]|uniref:5-carboxymethyl-2-hydroxymuconate isomerase n=1 Tax=Pseudahrensia aquimaris TaxID=744461 RepID=A0ABW3FD44_9HYPH